MEDVQGVGQPEGTVRAEGSRGERVARCELPHWTSRAVNIVGKRGGSQGKSATHCRRGAARDHRRREPGWVEGLSSVHCARSKGPERRHGTHGADDDVGDRDAAGAHCARGGWPERQFRRPVHLSRETVRCRQQARVQGGGDRDVEHRARTPTRLRSHPHFCAPTKFQTHC